ncbi:MAG TPA: cupin domain-containing protein [Acidobacteriaceae bacterium]|nr:cupin domain-containing protein [Acidobacteriaceae bacterium]
MRPATIALATAAFALSLSSLAAAQTVPQNSGTKNAINGINSYPGPGLVKYQNTPDPLNRRIDMFISDWHLSMPRVEHGSLILRDILTKGDMFDPPEKGAVLHYTNFFAYGRLAPGAWTTPSKLVGQQEIYYILGGDGEITSGGDTAKLHKNIAVLMPVGVEFVMHATGDDPLTMYVINEPLPDDNGIVGNPNRVPFHPKTKMVVKDEEASRIRTPATADPFIVGGASGHWAHIVREVFSPADGLATEQSVITVQIDPKTMGEPHPHRPGQEEVWAAIDGTSLVLLGTELRVQKPGMAYMLRPDAITVHSNINDGDKPVKFLYFARFPQGDNWTHAVLPAKK